MQDEGRPSGPLKLASCSRICPRSRPHAPPPPLYLSVHPPATPTPGPATVPSRAASPCGRASELNLIEAFPRSTAHFIIRLSPSSLFPLLPLLPSTRTPAWLITVFCQFYNCSPSRASGPQFFLLLLSLVQEVEATRSSSTVCRFASQSTTALYSPSPLSASLLPLAASPRPRQSCWTGIKTGQNSELNASFAKVEEALLPSF